MNTCPRDRVELAIQDVRGLYVRHCKTCAGLWVPGDVVLRIVGHLPRAASLLDAKPTNLCCPDDGHGLFALRHKGVEVDICRTCGGVWLDRGELELIGQKKEGGPAGSILDGIDAVEGVGSVVELAGNVIGFIFEALSGL